MRSQRRAGGRSFVVEPAEASAIAGGVTVSQPRLDTAVAPAGDVQGVELHESAAEGGGGSAAAARRAAARGGSQGLRRRVVGAEDVLAVVCGVGGPGWSSSRRRGR